MSQIKWLLGWLWNKVKNHFASCRVKTWPEWCVNENQFFISSPWNPSPILMTNVKRNPKCYSTPGTLFLSCCSFQKKKSNVLFLLPYERLFSTQMKIIPKKQILTPLHCENNLHIQKVSCILTLLFIPNVLHPLVSDYSIRAFEEFCSGDWVDIQMKIKSDDERDDLWSWHQGIIQDVNPSEVKVHILEMWTQHERIVSVEALAPWNTKSSGH